MTTSVAELIVRLNDQASGKAGEVARGLDKIAAAEKNIGAQSAELKKLSDHLANAQKGLQKIGDFREAQKGFAAARQAFNDTKKNVEELARKVADADRPARELTNSFKRAQSAVKAASAEFDRQKSSLMSAKSAMSDMGISIDRVSAAESKLQGRIDGATAAFKRQAAAEREGARAASIAADAAMRREQHRSQSRARASAMIGGFGLLTGGLVRHAATATLRTYREFDKERRFGKAVMGLTDEQQAPLVAQAIHGGATTKYNDIQFLEAQRELAARGLNKDSILGMMIPAANLGMASGQTLPEAVKQMEGAIFGFKKDISTVAAARFSATQTADVQTKAMKLSGMTPEDITQAYKYGATPARLSGVSENTLLGFAGILKKANIGGDESGVAFRALMSTIASPTRGAREAMLANGMDYKNYQKNPSSIALDPFVSNVAAQYGVKLNDKAKAALGKVFNDKGLISDPSKFTPAIMSVLSNTLGGADAKSKKSIAGMANRYRNASMTGVDSDRMINDLLVKTRDNLQFANAMFGSKQGGRIATALSDPETFNKMRKVLANDSDGFSKKIADERMAGFDGAVSRFEGSIKNLQTAIGRSADGGGSGGPLTALTDGAAKTAQALAELDSKTLAAGTAIAGVAGLWGAYVGASKFISAVAGGFGLSTSAAALDVSAAALTRAAVALGAKGIIPPVVPAVAPATPGIVARIAGTGAGGVAAGAVGGVLLGGALLEAARPTTPEAFPYRNMTFDPDANGIYERSRRSQMELKQGTDMEASRGRAFSKLQAEGESAGAQAGQAAGQGIVSGLRASEGAVEAQAAAIYESVKAKFSAPINLNVNVRESGMRGIHADAGVSP